MPETAPGASAAVPVRSPVGARSVAPGVAPADVGAVLVAGGTGFVGRIVVRSMVAAGRTVLVPSRSPDRLADLVARCGSGPGELRPLPMSGDDPHQDVAAGLRAADQPVRAVVAALGGWTTGVPLLDFSPVQWQTAVADHLTSHLQAMQAYVPLLAGADDPVYITLNGAAAIVPMPGSGAISVTGAAQAMLTQVMRVEPVGRVVRFHELGLLTAVSGDARNLDPASEIGPDAIAEAIETLLADPSAPARFTIDGATSS